MTLSTKLKKLRKEKNKSLQQVADAIKISKGQIWQLENGKSSNPTLNTLRKLADYYESSIYNLIDEDLGDDLLK